MAAMTVTLAKAFGVGYNRTYNMVGHSLLAVRVMLEKIKPGTGKQPVNRHEFTFVRSVVDKNGDMLAEKLTISVQIAVPRNADWATAESTTVATLMGQVIDVIGSDEAGTAILTGSHLAV